MKLSKAVFVILILPVIIFAGDFRLKGMNAQYFLPDREFDVNINPALLSRVDGIYIFGNLGMNIMSSNYFEDDYLGNNDSAPTNDTRNTKINTLNFSNTSLGALMTFNQIGVGIKILSDYQYQKEVVTKDPNDQTNTAADIEDSEEYKQGNFYNTSLFFSYDLGNIQLGLKAVYGSLPRYYFSSRTTNNVLKKSSRTKWNVKVNTIGGELGLTYTDNQAFLFGFSGFYFPKSGNDYSLDVGRGSASYANYIKTNDSFLTHNTIAGMTTGGKLLMEYKIASDSLLRGIVSGQYISLKSTFQNSNEFKKTYNLTNFKYEVLTPDLTMNSYFSFSKTFVQSLFFVGLGVNYDKSTTITSVDKDTTTKASMQGIELTDTDIDSVINSSLTFGAEGSITKWLTLRSGLTTTLFSLKNSSSRIVDTYDAVNSKVADTITSDTADSHTTILPSFKLKAGLTLKLPQNINLDIYSDMDFLGVNSKSSSSEWDNTRNINDKTKHNPKDTVKVTDFTINMGVTFRL